MVEMTQLVFIRYVKQKYSIPFNAKINGVISIPFATNNTFSASGSNTSSSSIVPSSSTRSPT